MAMFRVVLKDLLTNIWNFESSKTFMRSVFYGSPRMSRALFQSPTETLHLRDKTVNQLN